MRTNQLSMVVVYYMVSLTPSLLPACCPYITWACIVCSQVVCSKLEACLKMKQISKKYTIEESPNWQKTDKLVSKNRVEELRFEPPDTTKREI